MNPQSVHYINILFGAGAIVLQALTLFTIVTLLFYRKGSRYLAFIKDHFIEIGFLISAATFFVSAFYSEILHYIPCRHCWIQRIFILPQAFLFGVAWWRKDQNVLWYAWPLLTVGFLDAIYLVYIYYFNPSVPCDASGVSCVQQLVNEFGGYISIPTLSISGFAALLTLLAVAYFYKKGE